MIASKSAFTLLEVLVVITIIGALTSFLILDFQGVRERQEMALLGEQAQALLQQAQAEVRGGKVYVDEDSDGAIYVCEGAYLQTGAHVLFAVADYNVSAQTCDLSTLRTELYGLSMRSARLGKITVNDQSYSDGLYVLFSPPDAELLFYDEARLFDGEGVLEIGTLLLRLSSNMDHVYLETNPLEDEE